MIAQGELNIKQYTSQKNQDQGTLNSLHLKRNEDHTAYKEALSQHQNLILALDEVIKALKTLRGSISGVGRPDHVKALA